jgi:hypothetical protein
MTTRSWASNSFWETYDKNKITTILTTTNEDETVTTQQLTVSKFSTDGVENPDFLEILESIGEEKINENTTVRTEKKKAEIEAKEQRKIEDEKARQLQILFEAKIQAFEIEQIKNSTNRLLKSKLRKAQNLIEVNIYSMMIVMEELANEESKTE